MSTTSKSGNVGLARGSHEKDAGLSLVGALAGERRKLRRLAIAVVRADRTLLAFRQQVGPEVLTMSRLASCPVRAVDQDAERLELAIRWPG